MASLQAQNTETSEKNLEQLQNGAQLTVLNQTSQPITFVKSIDWSGSPASPGYPETIQANSPGLFTHVSNDNFGSKAAVIYSGKNSSLQTCAWLLAWLAPATSSPQIPNKVYVACGFKRVIEAMTDKEIRIALETSLSSPVNATDLDSGTTTNATISDEVPFMATVGAGFAVFK